MSNNHSGQADLETQTEYTFEFQVSSPDHGKRLDAFLAAQLAGNGISRQKIKQLISDGNVTVNGAPVKLPRRPLFPEQLVRLVLPAPENTTPEAQEGSLTIIYQNNDFLVLDKPPYLTVHPCPSCPKNTLVNILLHHFPKLAQTPGLRPGIVHRLDKDTSGLLLVALNEPTRLKLSAAFAARAVSKEYLALVMGKPSCDYGVINQPIARHPTVKTKMAVMPGGREAVSEYRIIYSGNGLFKGSEFSLLGVKIHTGRTHQIRVHLAAIGHPIWGDNLYGGAGDIELLPHPKTSNPKIHHKLKIANRQMLHAWKLSFNQPDTGKPLHFKSELPSDFMEALKALLDVPIKVAITGLPGCGKSALLNELQRLGLPIWSADAEVNRLYQQNKDGWVLLKNWYGNRFIDDSGKLDKQSLFNAMQTRPGLRKDIERLIHPLVQHKLADFWETIPPEAVANKTSILAAEVPLFLEAGWPRRNSGLENVWGTMSTPDRGKSSIKLNQATPGTPLLIYVDTPTELRYQRLKQRGVEEAKAAVLDSWQWPEAEKRAACDLIIDNSQSLEHLKEAAKELKLFLGDFQRAVSKHNVHCILDRLESFNFKNCS